MSVYVPTAWKNDDVPAINAVNLNHIENGIYEAHVEIEANAQAINDIVGEILVIPTGLVMPFASYSPIPDGYLRCEGQTVSRTTYSRLYTVIGTVYGAGNGSSTFNVPDMRGQFMRGYDAGRGIDPTRAFGSTQEDMLKAHSHRVRAQEQRLSMDNIQYDLMSADSGFLDDRTEETGGTETRPTNVAMCWLIKD